MRDAFVVLVFCSLAASCGGDPPAAPAADAGAARKPPAVSSKTKPTKAPDALATQNTNWGSTVADVMEFRRKGNVLTAVVRLRQAGLISLNFSGALLLDEAQGRKYKVLTDENGEFIACCHGTTALSETGELTYWMKFPAPPPEIKSVTLVLPETVPFEELAIQNP